MAVTHTFVSAIADGADTTLVRPSNWNDDHDVSLTASDVGADPAGTASSAVSTHAGLADPHTGYVQESLFAAKGDIISASASATPSVLTAGANDTILMADSSATTGLKWVASASPSAVGTAAATGTADTFTRGDHVHAHEAAHLDHDTTWAAQGDLIVGTANDTAAVLTKGAAGTFLQAGASTVGYVNVFVNPTFSKAGVLATGAGTLRWYNQTGRTLTFAEVCASVGTAPATQSILCDVNVDGTTIWATQGNRVAVAAAANVGSSTTFDTTTIADGHYLTVDIDQVGTGTLGSDLTVTIWMTG